MKAQRVSRQLNIRVSPGLVRALDEISEAEQLDRTTVVKRLLSDAIRDWRVNRAVELVRQDKLTRERAAEMAGLSLYEMMDLTRQEGYSSLTLAETVEELKRLLEPRP